MSMGGERKRAYSTPHIMRGISRMMATTSAENFSALDNSMNFNKLGMHNYDQVSMWPTTAGNSESSIYTSLAMGDERYKLAGDVWTRESSVGLTDDDEMNEDEAKDQFSPTLYNLNRTRSIPIPISAGNSPQHMPTAGLANLVLGSGQQTPNLQSPTHLAFSASPSATGQAFSPFYSSSPETQLSGAGAQISQSYDPTFGASINRLIVPVRRHTQPQPTKARAPQSPAYLTTPLESASAILFATSPTSSVNRLATHRVNQSVQFV